MPFVIDPPVSSPLPLPPDEATALWEVLYEAMGFHRATDPETGYQLRALCQVLMTPMQELYDIVRERPGMAGGAIMLDPDNAPAKNLRFLSQWVGARLTAEMSEQQVRNEIRQPTGWKRGQPETIRIKARSTLDPTVAEPLVIIHARTPEVGCTYVRTLLSQTPEPARTKAVLEESIPAWELLNYEAITGPTWADIAASSKWSTWAELAMHFPTYQALTEALPSDL